MTNIVTLMRKVNGATFISITTCTEPPLRRAKTNPLIGRVHKITVDSSVMVFQNKSINGYEAMVHRRLINEGKDPDSFILSPRQWGTRIANLPFVEHKGHHYLEVIFLRPGNTFYTIDGIRHEPNDIDGLILDRFEPEQGGLTNKVVVRTFKIDSLVSITINKKTYSNLTFKL